MKRRTLLSLAAAGTLCAAVPAFGRKIKPLKILILGGTRFIGLHMTALALQRGHTLTFFNRGKTKTDRYPEVERIKGDRNGEIDGLKNRQWDVVIDNSGYVPRHVRLSAELLASRVRQYVFTSSISVYPDFSVPRDEKSPVGKLADESVEKVDGDTYGPLKALCEQAVLKTLPGRATIIRPGLIVGPDDNTDRFTYWPARAARGGEFIAPGAPADPFQIIDVRDLAAFVLNAVERNITGTFNLVSNVNAFKFGELTDACVAAANKQAKPAAPRHLDPDGVSRGAEGRAMERDAGVAAGQG
jgi:2'-hydroxyisoflavone reductase